MNAQYEMLTWDTEFFGYPVAKINGGCLSDEELEFCLLNLNTKAKLVYYSSEKPLESDRILHEFNGLLVDKKTTFVKENPRPATLNPAIVEYNADMPLNELIDLSQASGVYSRYRIDPRIENEKCDDLYKQWILNAIQHQLADRVLVYQIGQKLAGLITLGTKNNRADIGIVAVQARERGKGIGKALLSAADVFSKEKMLTAIQVVTQGANLPACALYHSAGYEVRKVEYFYHFCL